MKKLLIVLLIIIVCIGCKKNSSSNEIKPTSIYNPTPEDVTNFLEESNKIGKVDTDKDSNSKENTNIPFQCKELEYEVFLSINRIRKENNLEELQWDEELYPHIITRTEELPQKFSHTRPDGSTCFTVSKRLHGENIAKGYSSSNAVVKGWMNSQGHKENILNKSYKRTAIGYIKKDSGTYWCQGFGY